MSKGSSPLESGRPSPAASKSRAAGIAALFATMLPVATYVYQDQQRQIDAQREVAEDRRSERGRAATAALERDTETAHRLLDAILTDASGDRLESERMCERFYYASEMVRRGVQAQRTHAALVSALRYVPELRTGEQTGPRICECPLTLCQMGRNWAEVGNRADPALTLELRDTIRDAQQLACYQPDQRQAELCAQAPRQVALISEAPAITVATAGPEAEALVEQPATPAAPPPTASAEPAEAAKAPADCGWSGLFTKTGIPPMPKDQRYRLRVYIHVQSEPPEAIAAAERLRTALTDAGYLVPPIDPIDRGRMPRIGAVRFGADGDRDRAHALATSINGWLPADCRAGQTFRPDQLKLKYRLLIMRDSFEIWFGRRDDTPGGAS